MIAAVGEEEEMKISSSANSQSGSYFLIPEAAGEVLANLRMQLTILEHID